MTAVWKPALTLPANFADRDPSTPVLVLGHSLGSSHEMWDDVVELLQPWVVPVRYDLPGHGASPIADAPVTMADVLAGLAIALDEAGVGDFHLAGLSIGGLIALSARHHLGERVLSVATLASGPKAGEPQTWQERIASVRTQGVEPFVEPTMSRWFTDAFARGRGKAWVERIEGIYRACQSEGYIQCCQVLATTDANEWLADITCPTLVVAGVDDPGFDLMGAYNLTETIRAASGASVQMLLVQEARHMVATEHPHLVAGALLDTVLHRA